MNGWRLHFTFSCWSCGVHTVSLASKFVSFVRRFPPVVSFRNGSCGFRDITTWATEDQYSIVFSTLLERRKRNVVFLYQRCWKTSQFLQDDL